MNIVHIVGRMTSDLEINEVENRKEYKITLAITRCQKNEDGIYETDFIPILMFGSIGSNVNEYCKKGDLIGVKGSLQVIENKLCVVAEKVTFLSSSKGE